MEKCLGCRLAVGAVTRYTGSMSIGTLNEKSLHAALKEWYARPGDQFEVDVDGSIIDIVRGDLLVEIQTRNFSALKSKLGKLTRRHPVRLVYPIAREKWIVKLDNDEETRLSRRKSPKRGAVAHIFTELVYLHHLVPRPTFSLEVVLIQEEELRRFDAQKAKRWRHSGWVTHERLLLTVLEQRLFTSGRDLAALLPEDLDEPFTTADLAAALGQSRRLAQRMAYCLREIGQIESIAKRGNAYLYRRSDQ